MAVASELAASGRSRLSFLLLWAAKPSLAISAGANVVQKLLGHKTAVLTLDRYGHLFPDDLDAVATAFDAAAQSAVDRLRTGRLLKIASSPE